MCKFIRRLLGICRCTQYTYQIKPGQLPGTKGRLMYKDRVHCQEEYEEDDGILRIVVKCE